MEKMQSAELEFPFIEHYLDKLINKLLPAVSVVKLSLVKVVKWTERELFISYSILALDHVRAFVLACIAGMCLCICVENTTNFHFISNV